MSEHDDTVQDGTIMRRCSKCKMPCKGHVGPPGSSCSMATAEDHDIITEQPEPIEVHVIHEPEGAEAIHSGRLSEHLLNTLVSQMTMMNTNFQTMIEGQVSLTNAVERSITSSPPTLRAATRQAQPLSIPDTDTLDTTTPTLSLPGGARVSEKTAKAAINGEFINLAEFLPSFEHKDHGREVEPILDDDGKLTFQTRRPRKSINNLNQWLSSWNNYEYLVVSSCPARYAEMSKYRDFIMKCAHKYQWYAVFD